MQLTVKHSASNLCGNMLLAGLASSDDASVKHARMLVDKSRCRPAAKVEACNSHVITSKHLCILVLVVKFIRASHNMTWGYRTPIW